MGRFKGTFEVPANYEPQKAAPFDARQLVETKADLILASTWQDSKGDMWIYSGMIVSVASDINSKNNGVYVLQDAAYYYDLNYWTKLASDKDIADLQEQIDNIDISGEGSGSDDIVVETYEDLPLIGDENITYYVKENFDILRWNSETGEYDSYGGDDPSLDINMIYGGNAYGTD